MLCLVVEASAVGGELPPLTQDHPGATVELIGEPPGQDAGDTITTLMLVRGAPWQAIDQFVEQLSRTKAPVTTIRRSPVESLWFGRATFHTSAFRTPGAIALRDVFKKVGPPWVHIEHGVAHLRARVKDPEHADDLVTDTVESLRKANVDAQVIVQEVAPKDHSVWENLVQLGIGISL